MLIQIMLAVAKVQLRKGVAIGLGNIASMAQIQIGELKAAEENLRRGIEIDRQIKDEYAEATWHNELGCVLTYRGQFEEAKRELATAWALFEMEKHVQGNSVNWASRALRVLLMGDTSAALDAARKAREFAEEQAKDFLVERDFIRAEWLLGAALVAEMATPHPDPPPSSTGEGEANRGRCARKFSPCEAGGVRGGCRTPSPRSTRA